MSISNSRLILTLFLILSFVPLASDECKAQELPFSPGEKLSYLISWSFIPAARATLEVSPSLANAPEGTKYHFILTAHTLPAIALIYPFQERIDSFVADNLAHTLMYKKAQESRHSRDIIVRFNWDSATAQFSNFGQNEPPIQIPPGTLDPLSALYYIRSQQLRTPFTFEHPVTDGKKLSLGKAKLIKKETLTIRGKTYQTIKIEPDLRDVKGVFEKSPGATMHIWLTDDSRKILVKLKSKVVVGSFVAELIEEESNMPGDLDSFSKRENTNKIQQQNQPVETMGNTSNIP